MRINIKATNLKLNPEISQYINEKISGLEKFVKGLDFDSQVWIEVGTTTKHHKSGPIYRAEIQMRLPGASLRAESQSEDLRLAINESKEKLERELKESKDRGFSTQKRTARFLKTVFRLSPLARIWRKGWRRTRFAGRIKEEDI